MDFILDALIDSLKLLPFLLLSYILIEVIEYFFAEKMEHSRLLNGKYSVIAGSAFGLIPQCGFSVVATDLFASKKIPIGTLIAIYIATSDEAIPTLIMYPSKALSLLPLLAIKFIVAVVAGLIINQIASRTNAKAAQTNVASPAQTTQEATTETEAEHAHHTGCCGHEIEGGSKKDFLKIFIWHPLVHTLKIFLFILIANLLFGGLIALVTEEKLMAFLSSSKAFAPLFASLIGLIPNCASSVILTSLYVHSSISFGAMMTGLIINAGIAIVVLFRQNKNIKQNMIILSTLYLIGLVVGYLIDVVLMFI